MRTHWQDTPPDLEEMILEGFRRMSPSDKLNRVQELNRAVRAMASAGIRARYGPSLSRREMQLRLGALGLSRETMVEVFDWDPMEKGR